ncbi:dTDP-4-dehydrorhamnose reductase [Planctomycetota bacterium]
MSFPATVAILGGRGMLGTDLAASCRAAGAEVRIFDLPEFDITQAAHVRKALIDCNAVVNCAAYTNVDGAESEPEVAQRVNADAVGQLAALAGESGAYVLHISTDFIFDGRLDRPYAESDIPQPLSVYGATKLAGEQQFFAGACNGAIVRLQWTYGTHGNNFVTKLLERARAQGALKVVDDQIGSPTTTTAVSQALCSLLGKQPTGLFHYANSGYVSRFDVAGMIVKVLGLGVTITPCKTHELNSPAQRPLNSRFDCSKIAAFLDAPIPTWQESLHAFLEKL